MLALVYAAPALTIFKVFAPKGVGFVHHNSPSPSKHLLETMGGGVALLDYDNDGLLDLFLVNSGQIDSSPGEQPNFHRSSPGNWNRLYQQQKDGTFRDVTEQAGLNREADSHYGMGVSAADFDNDGFTDLYVTNYGSNTLYHNNRNGTFTDVTAKSGTAVGGWSTSSGWFDYDRDGLLDLFVDRYMDWNFARSHPCDRNTYCLPGIFPAVTDVLLRNRGDGTFEDVSAKSGIAAVKGRSLGVAFNDYDHDGWPDIFVANDGMAQFLFHNDGNGHFKDVALEAGTSLSDDGDAYAGMGVAFQDYDNDSWPDILVTNLARQVYALYRNENGQAFSYKSRESGLTSLTARSSGWGLALEDFDNDGWKDLLVAQGHVMDNVETLDASLLYRESPLLALNEKGRFSQVLSGCNQQVAGRGLAFGDIRNTGHMDAILAVLGGSPLQFENQAPTQHWLDISLQGSKSNRDSLGTVIHAGKQTYYVTTAGSYLSASDKRVHLGLGSETETDLVIEWPSGTKQTLSHVLANQFITIQEPRP